MNKQAIIRSTRILTIFLLSAIGGCTVGPDFHSPPAPQASRYTHHKIPHRTVSAPTGDSGKSQKLNYGHTIPAEWWKLFHSAKLNFLMQQGIKNNQTLEAAKKSLEVAEDTLRAQIGKLYLPAFDLNMGAGKTQVAGIQFGNVAAPASIFSIYNAQVQASYNLDLFGGGIRMVEYYRAQAEYQNYEMLAAYLSLTANIATTAITISSLEAQVAATKELIRIETNVLNIQQARLKDGGISQEDVLTQETLLAQTIALLPPLEKSLADQNTALAVLTGSLTSNSPPLHLNLNGLNLPANLPVSVPSILVEQRPDILAAEALMHGMSAKIGVATARLLPKITLTGDYGWTAQAPSLLFQPLSVVWDIAGQLLQPIFHGGQYLYERKATIAEYEEYYAKYKNVVLEAFKEVADALQAIEIDAKQFKAEVNAEISSKKTFDTAFKRYKLGGENYLNALTAQQKYLQNKINRIKSQASRYTDTAALFQALGGGWWDIPVLPQPESFATRRAKV